MFNVRVIVHSVSLLPCVPKMGIYMEFKANLHSATQHTHNVGLREPPKAAAQSLLLPL